MDVDEVMRAIQELDGNTSEEAIALLQSYSDLLELLLASGDRDDEDHRQRGNRVQSSQNSCRHGPPLGDTSSISSEKEQSESTGGTMNGAEWGWMVRRPLQDSPWLATRGPLPERYVDEAQDSLAVAIPTAPLPEEETSSQVVCKQAVLHEPKDDGEEEYDPFEMDDDEEESREERKMKDLEVGKNNAQDGLMTAMQEESISISEETMAQCNGDDELAVRMLRQKRIATWEVYTTGIGSRVLMKFGYVPGEGLGKAKQGRATPLTYTGTTATQASSLSGNGHQNGEGVGSDGEASAKECSSAESKALMEAAMDSKHMYGLGHLKRKSTAKSEFDQNCNIDGIIQVKTKRPSEAVVKRRNEDTQSFFSFLNETIQTGGKKAMAVKSPKVMSKQPTKKRRVTSSTSSSFVLGGVEGQRDSDEDEGDRIPSKVAEPGTGKRNALMVDLTEETKLPDKVGANLIVVEDEEGVGRAASVHKKSLVLSAGEQQELRAGRLQSMERLEGLLAERGKLMEGIERTTRRGNSSSAAALRDRLGELDKRILELKRKEGKITRKLDHDKKRKQLLKF